MTQYVVGWLSPADNEVKLEKVTATNPTLAIEQILTKLGIDPCEYPQDLGAMRDQLWFNLELSISVIEITPNPPQD